MAYALAGGLFDTPGFSGGAFSETCVDVVGNYPNPNDLTLTQNCNVLWWVSGINAGWWRTERYAVPRSGIPNFSSASSPIPSDNVVLSTVLGRTNPSTPKVDVPAFIAELYDVPRLIRDWGKQLLSLPSLFVSKGKHLSQMPQFAAKKYVEWEFAVAPFIRDLQGMIQFQNLVAKKLRVLEKLGDPSSQSFTATAYENTVDSWSGWAYATSLYQEHRKVYLTDQTVRKVWGSTVWKPSIPLPQNDADRAALAFRLAFGFQHISLATMWEIMPWSWLFDWYGNVGDLLNANRDGIPVTHGGSCIMRQTQYTQKITGTPKTLPADTTSVVVPPYVRSEKTRKVLGDASPILEFNLPVLDGRQLSILAALLVSRQKPF
nr:MAG: putative maturation protein [Leviviridae sp.]